MKIKFALITLWIILQADSAFAGDTIIVSGNPGYPPLMWHEGTTIVGGASEMVRTIFEELEVPFEIEFRGPWKRVLLQAKNGDIDLIMGLYKTLERQIYLDYTIPITTNPTAVFVLKGKKFPFRRWEDLIGKVGNVIHGESFGTEFDQFLKQKLTVERSSTMNQNFLKLEHGRVDYFVTGLYIGLISLYDSGFENKIEPLPHPVVEQYTYMAFSKKSRFKHLIPEVNTIIERLKKEGIFEIWLEKYIDYYKATHRGDKGANI